MVNDVAEKRELTDEITEGLRAACEEFVKTLQAAEPRSGGRRGGIGGKWPQQEITSAAFAA